MQLGKEYKNHKQELESGDGPVVLVRLQFKSNGCPCHVALSGGSIPTVGCSFS
jgi:hypothetical protein